MSEYIKREDALNKSERIQRDGAIDDDFVVTVADINAIPAADVEPVVRCKNCEYGGKIDSIFQTWCKKRHAKSE